MKRRRKLYIALGVLAVAAVTLAVARWQIDRRGQRRLDRLREIAGSELRQIEARRFLRPAEEGPWEPGNAWDLYAPAFTSLGSSFGVALSNRVGEYLRGLPGAASEAEMREYLVRFAGDLRAVEEAQRREDYTADWRRARSSRSSPWTGASSAANLLRLRAHFALQDGDPAAAVEDLLRMGRLARDLEGCPLVIAHMVGSSILHRMGEGVRELLGHRPIDAAHAAALADGLTSIRRREHPLLEAWRTEWAWSTWQATAPPSGKAACPPALPSLGGRLRQVAQGAPWLWSSRAMGADYLECHTQHLVRAVGPWRDGLADIRVKHGWRHEFMECAMPSLGSQATRTEEALTARSTELAGLEAAARVLAHRLRTGSWPASLEEVEGVPPDPSAQRPFRYAVQGGAVHLSSALGEFAIELSP